MYYALLVVDDDGCPRMFGTTHRAAHATRVAARDPATRRPGLARDTDEGATAIEYRIDLGVTRFRCWFLDLPDPTGMELFADEVASEFH
jgi:hypothetical protein